MTLDPDSQTKTVHVAAKAVVLNDAEGLVVEELACVAGFPNIKFSLVTDPMTRHQTVKEFLESLDSESSSVDSYTSKDKCKDRKLSF